MILGFTKWFNNEKGFGVIESLDNVEYFLHISDVDRKPEKVSLGTPFLFEESESKAKKKAVNAIIPLTDIDFATGIDLLIKQKGVITHKVIIKGESRWGNPYKREETRNMDTLNIFIESFPNDIESLFNCFKAGFDKNYRISWTHGDLSEYYNITKNEIKKIIKKTIKDSITNSGLTNNSKKDYEKLITRLFDYYDSKLSDEEKFKIHSHKIILGYTKKFNNDSGFGYIESLDNVRYLLQTKNINGNPGNILIGTPFLFKESESVESKIAINANVPETNIDFAIGLNLLIKQKGIIPYIVTITGESRWGNPYKREETRKMDTIGIFIRRISRDKGIEALFHLFKAGFDNNYRINWTHNDLSEYYNITKKEIKNLQITLTEEEQKEKDEKRQKEVKNSNKTWNIYNRTSDNEEVINRLIDYYDSKLSDEDAFSFWHEKIQHSHFYGKEKEKISISENILLKNKNKLEANSITKITKHIDISNNTFKQLVNPFFEQKIDGYEKLENALSIYNNLDIDLKPIYFKLLTEAITEDLYYNNWKIKNYYIDHEKQNINSYKRYNIDYDLPRELYFKKIKEIKINQLERIQKLRPNDNELIEKIITNIFNSQNINDYSFKRFIPILEKTNQTFVGDLLDGLFKSTNTEFENQLTESDTIDLINLYKFFKRDYIYKLILNKLDLDYTYYFEELIKHSKFTDEFGFYILDKISSSDLSTSSMLYYLTYLSKEKFDYNISILTSLFKRNLSFDELIKVYEFSVSLNAEEYTTIELLLANSIEKVEEIFDKDYITLLKIESKTILEATLSLKCKIKTKDSFSKTHFQEKSDDLIYLEAFCTNKISSSVNADLLMEFITPKINLNENYICNYLITNRVELLPTLANELELNERIISLFLELFEKNQEVIRPYTSLLNYDVEVIYSIVDTAKSKLDFEKLNTFFRKHNYRFQELFLKYFINLFHKNHINKDKYISIQNSIEIKQLSALMIKGFINGSSFNGRDALMELMNTILKEHFMLMHEINDKKELFNNIYSISGLVKSCDGRKTFKGLEFWQGGKITRNYTDGNHYIQVGQSENIYCEGRFWKKEIFYDSKTNKPLQETHDFYWCRNKKCVGVNDKLKLDDSFSNWTLTEINKIFNIGLDRLSFVHLAGWLNRMDTIYSRLNCYDCNNYLRPKAYTPKLLGFYGVPLFSCVNSNCESHEKLIRFTHCRGCHKILDSRECETCQNCNWLICDDKGCEKCGCGANHTPIYSQYD